MTTIVEATSSVLEGAESSPDPELVPPSIGPRPDARPEPRPEFFSLLVLWVTLTSIAIFVGSALPMWAFTGHIWDGIGLGAFSAFWGGPGFGLMVAGAIWTSSEEGLSTP